MLIFWLVLSIIGMSLNTFYIVLSVLKADYAAATFHLILFLIVAPAFVISCEELAEKRRNK